MKSVKAPLIMIAIALFAFSCSNQANNEDQEVHDAHDTHEDHGTHSSHDMHEAEAGALQLDNGEKWTVNEEMRPHILESEIMLNEYIANDSDDYKALAAALKENNSELVQSCTMKGESHDELHKWLHPHMVLISSLENADNADESQIIITQLDESFETYHQYFR